jgi:hypothetical protein
MARPTSRDVVSGAVLIGIGAAAVALVSDLPVGSATRMGPAYLPMLLGGLLVLFGAAILAAGLRSSGARPSGAPAGGLPWRPLVLVPAGLAAFGAALDALGFVAAAALLLLSAALADRSRRWPEVATGGAGLILLSLAVFRYGLGLPFKVWP